MSQLPMHAGTAIDELMDDAVALQRFATHGDPAAFRALTQRYQTMVFASCKRVLRSQADAEDAAQETFLKFARAAATIRGNAAAWLHACAIGTATDLLRRKTTRERIERDATTDALGSDEHRTWKELEPMLDAALAKLPEADRDAIIGHFLVGRTQKDLAREAGIAPGTMSRRIDAALEQLAASLKATTPALAGAAGLAAVLTVGAKSAAASPALAGSLAKVALVDVAISGKSATATSAGFLSGKALLIGTAALLAIGGTATVLTLNASGTRQVPVALTAAAVATETEPQETYQSMAKPTGESDPFTMSAQKLGNEFVDTFQITIDPTRVIYLGGTNETGERAVIEGDRLTDLDVKPASEGKEGKLALRVTKFAMFQDPGSPDPTGKVSTLTYTIKDGIMRGRMKTEGEKNGPEDDLAWRRDPKAANAIDPADPLRGSWTQIPIWWSLRFQKDSIELCGGEERWVMQRFRIISWTEESSYSKVETICVDNYVNKSLIGKRMKLLVRKTADEKYQVAHWEADSPKINEWPTFTPKPEDKIRIVTFMKEIK